MLIEELRTRRELPPPEVARMIREAAGVSQRRLGQELGVTKETIARWESGTHRPRASRVSAYARLLRDIEAAS